MSRAMSVRTASAGPRRRSKRASSRTTANCWCAPPGVTLAPASSPSTSKNPRSPKPPGLAAGFTPGDIVRADRDGNLHFVDRKKNIIRRSGENISAAEVESVLRRHPAVAEVAVTSVADELREEEVLACIVPHAAVTDPPATAAAIIGAALKDLSYFKVPGWVVFVEALPLTASQKVARGELKAAAADFVAGSGCVDTRGLKRR